MAEVSVAFRRSHAHILLDKMPLNRNPDAHLKLQKFDVRLAEVYRMKAGADCSEANIAAVLGISQRVVCREIGKAQILMESFDPPSEDGMTEIGRSPLLPRPPLSTQCE